MRIAERHTELLHTQMLDADLLDHCRMLQEIVNELSDLESSHKLQVQTMKGEMAEVRTRYAEILKVVKSGTREQHIEVQTEHDLDAKMVRIRRMDTGQVLREHRMDDDEFREERARQAQAELPLPSTKTTTPAAVEVPPISGPLLASCEACGHKKGDHGDTESSGPNTGTCLISPCQCTEYVAFSVPVPAEEALHPIDPDQPIAPENAQANPICESCSHTLSTHDGPDGPCLIIDCQCAGFMSFAEEVETAVE